MRETDAPWRSGKGCQFRTNKYTLQVGLCKKLSVKDETEGILNAVGGRMLDISVDEIGNW